MVLQFHKTNHTERSALQCVILTKIQSIQLTLKHYTNCKVFAACNMTLGIYIIHVWKISSNEIHSLIKARQQVEHAASRSACLIYSVQFSDVNLLNDRLFIFLFYSFECLIRIYKLEQCLIRINELLFCFYSLPGRHHITSIEFTS